MTTRKDSPTLRRSVRLAILAMVVVGIQLAGSASTSGPIGPREQPAAAAAPHMTAL